LILRLCNYLCCFSNGFKLYPICCNYNNVQVLLMYLCNTFSQKDILFPTFTSWIFLNKFVISFMDLCFLCIFILVLPWLVFHLYTIIILVLFIFAVFPLWNIHDYCVGFLSSICYRVFINCNDPSRFRASGISLNPYNKILLHSCRVHFCLNVKSQTISFLSYL
jgi:hypothetical protein